MQNFVSFSGLNYLELNLTTRYYMFSSRTNWNLLPNKLSQLIEERRKQGHLILDLTESNPTKVGFDFNDVNILTPLQHKNNLIYEPDPKGLIDARVAVSGYYKQHGINVNAENIILTSGSSEGYSFILRLIAEVNDEVLVPIPSYPLLSIISQLNDVVLKHYRLIYDGEWHIDFDSLESAITKKTKAILVIHPNNPTGSYIKRYEYKKLAEIADKYNLAIISDEVFLDYPIVDDGQRLESFARKNDVLTFTISGISKMLGLPQMKLGWIVVSGSHKHASVALSRLEMIADTYLSVSIPIQNSLARWLNQFHQINSKILNRVKHNYSHLTTAVEKVPSATVLFVEGGWNAIIKLPNIRQDDEWVEYFIQNSNVLFQPGYFYDFEENANIVMSLIQKPEIVEKALFLSIYKELV